MEPFEEAFKPVGKWAEMEAELAQSEVDERREVEEQARLAALRNERLKTTHAPLDPKANFEEAMFGAGLGTLWEVRQAATSVYRQRDAADEQRIFEQERSALGEPDALGRERQREQIENGLEWLAEPPLWQQVSGLIPSREMGLHPGARAAGIRRLLKKVERLIRFEVRSAAQASSLRESGADGRGEEENERQRQHAGWKPAVREVDACALTAQWDPLQSICSYLGIALRKLSALSREVSGLAVTQLADAIKAESLWKKWKRRVGDWVAAQASDAGEIKERAYRLWKMLRGERQKKGSHRSSFAFAMGFSSYSRMFRACLVCYGLAPQEMELELIEECLEDGNTQAGSLRYGAPCAGGQAESQTDLPQSHEETGNG